MNKNCAFVFLTYLFFCILPILGQEANNAQIDILVEKAIEDLKNNNIDNLYAGGKHPAKEKVKKSEELIIKHKELALLKLKEKVEKEISQATKDYIFLQEAAFLVWKINEMNDLAFIINVWKYIPYEHHSNGVYKVLIEAAEKKDPSLLPLLKFSLENHKGSFFTENNGIHIRWPETSKLIWSLWGYKSLAYLLDILKSPEENPKVKQSAILILTQAQFLPALEIIRTIAEDNSGDTNLRSSAIASLGIFGHPNDFDLIIKTFSESGDDLLFASSYALFEFGDIRAVPFLIKKIDTKNDIARLEMLACLSHLVSNESIETLYNYCHNPKNKNEEKFCSTYFINFKKETGLDITEYHKLNNDKKEQIIQNLIKNINKRYNPSKLDNQFKESDYIKLKELWKKEQTLLPSGYEWLKLGDLINVMSENELPFLYDILGIQYKNITYESFSEINTIEELIKCIGRKRYRKELGIAKKIE